VFEGLLIDWGGVLTTSLLASFNDYCVRTDIDPALLMERLSARSGARELLISLEKGEIDEPAFEQSVAVILEVDPDGLIDGLFAAVEPDLAMIEAVRLAHDAGIRTGLVSNSWGLQRYPHELLAEIFDGIVISAEEGIRKPSRRMYELGAERAGVAADRCIYVDDLAFNLVPAEKLGMTAVHHSSAATTIPELERLLEMSLR
jgi:epoxide hydrolase-like predicted phosphatase